MGKEIVLPAGIEYVATADIPELIVNALNRDDAGRLPSESAHYYDVEQKHRVALISAINAGQLNVVVPHTRLPPKKSEEFAITEVSLNDLRQYVAKYQISVRLDVEPQRADTSSRETDEKQDKQRATTSAPAIDEGLTKRERQIRAIEEAADAKGFPRHAVPDGGKKVLREYCKLKHHDLFGAGDSSFNDAWKKASPNRVAMANRAKFAGE
ncbi:hypothetical protein [Burkholderia seminalis]|uniref:hypothetical protein n=1 Tax=Burkholderia seminalis TaxID=488731 RepID=UPI00158EC7ED|nr:hypothetical protein [Burkholderia seminalis]